MNTIMQILFCTKKTDQVLTRYYYVFLKILPNQCSAMNGAMLTSTLMVQLGTLEKSYCVLSNL